MKKKELDRQSIFPYCPAGISTAWPPSRGYGPVTTEDPAPPLITTTDVMDGSEWIKTSAIVYEGQKNEMV
jgi:hypothetical protein